MNKFESSYNLSDEALTTVKIESASQSSSTAADNALNSRMNIPDSDSEYRQWLQSIFNHNI
jgi:hypothetical protein